MQSGITFKALRRSNQQGHAHMEDLQFLTFPYIGRIYIQRDRITPRSFGREVLVSRCGTEYLFYLGSLRVYLTPDSALAAERNPRRC